MVQERKLTSIRLSAPLYEYLQKKAKKENRSVNNYIETVLINDWEKEPNEETLKAFAETENMVKNGTGKRYSNVEDLMKDLQSE